MNFKINKTWIYSLFILCCCSSGKEDITQEPLVYHSKNYISFDSPKKIEKDWKRDNELVYQVAQLPENLHPIFNKSSSADVIFSRTQIYLLSTDLISLAPSPQLAISLPEKSRDGLEFTYKLKKDLKWDDGSEISVKDVLFTYKINNCSLIEDNPIKFLLNNIETIAIKSDNEIYFRFKKSHFLNFQVSYNLPILQQSKFDPTEIINEVSLSDLQLLNANSNKFSEIENLIDEIKSDKFGKDLTFLSGGGNYRIENWIPNHELTLRIKEKYVAEYPFKGPQKIIYRSIKDPISQNLNFIQQKIDVSTNVESKTLMELMKNDNFKKNYNYAFVETLGYTYLAFNTKPEETNRNQIFNDKKNRIAVAHLIPYSQLNQIAYLNQNTRSHGPVSKFKPECNPKLTSLDYNPSAAEKILFQAGWRDEDNNGILEKKEGKNKTEFQVDLSYYNSSPIWNEMALLIKNSLEKFKIKVNLNCKDPKRLQQDLSNHHFDIFLGAKNETLLPEDFFALWHSDQWKNKGFNYTGFGDKITDQLIDSLEFCTNETIRLKLSHQLQEIINQDHSFIFLFNGMKRIIIHKRWENQIVSRENPYVNPSSLQLIHP